MHNLAMYLMKTADTALAAEAIMSTAPLLMRKMRVRIIEATCGDLTLAQYRILANVNRGLTTVSEIAIHHGVSQPAMTKMIAILIRRKLLKKQASTNDRRQSILAMTSAGRLLFTKVRANAKSMIAEDLNFLTPKDRSELADALTKVQRILAGANK